MHGAITAAEFRKSQGITPDAWRSLVASGLAPVTFRRGHLELINEREIARWRERMSCRTPDLLDNLPFG